MTLESLVSLIGIAAAALIARKIQIRLRLSRAKHPSLSGHAKLSRRLAKLMPFYEYQLDEAFASDHADARIVEIRKKAFERLAVQFAASAPRSIEFSNDLEESVSDMRFTNAYRVPFQYRALISSHLNVASVATASSGVMVQDLDGNWAYDVSGSYGVNLLGYDFYKDCIDKGIERVRSLGPVLGPYHPVIAENVSLLREISGLDQVSFHMSGTEAVMQAVGLARYHTQRSHLVMFCGAYHGWWDGVQPGIGGQRRSSDIYLLQDNSEYSLKVLTTRNDIACVLVNPLQALHPNRSATSDAMLINSDRSAGFDRVAYTLWLQKLRQVCDKRGIALIFDEVFVGFRLGPGGAQKFFDVQADLITYGKTVGGGLPIGVLCGKSRLMQRYKTHAPTDICFARGTFNSHPYVMASMNEFLRVTSSEAFAAQMSDAIDVWDTRAARLNEKFQQHNLPLKIHNLSSVWILTYTQPSRYNWMYQYYLRAHGLALSWVGTARFIFSHNYTESDFEAVSERFIRAAIEMQADGWWLPKQQATNRQIRRQVFSEIVTVLLSRLRRTLQFRQS